MTELIDDAVPALLNAYHRDPHHYHELLEPSGEVRAPWRRMLNLLQNAEPAQMRARADFVERQIRENGVTYNVYADAKGTDRPWELDLLPHIIESSEWQKLAAGIAQRAALLDAVLADLYGAQTLLAEGLLPPELVFGHENFLWPCQGIAPPGGIFLHIYAIDLARAPDGSWWAVADRTQAPSGMGYAIENRQIISRAYSDLFHDMRVRDLSAALRALQATLQAAAPANNGESPLAVLLTPGRYNESYFEHVYLARALGMPLVEGYDLTVRADTVYMKTLGGLKRVHTILRRVDDDYCDPLELRGESALGVPGLAAAARAGRVLIANALGTGVLESPGLLGFLPKICAHLRGETLAIPSVATWWCGEASVREEAFAELDRLVIKPAFPSRHAEPLFGPSLPRSRLAELRARIEAEPAAWVAQELVDLSQAPVWQRSATQAQIVPRAVSMRAFAIATGNGQYMVMPGALSRVATKAAARIVSMQRGGGSKDTWVLTDGKAAIDTPSRRELRAADVVRKDDFLPSRLIENLFWVGRYSERSDDCTRLLRIVLSRYIDTSAANTAAFEAALAVCRQVKLIDGEAKSTREALLGALTDTSAPYSLASVLSCLLWSSGQVRGRLSSENWRGLLEVQREARALDRTRLDFGDVLELLNRLLMEVSALSGFALDDMTRDDGWRFLMIGRRLERLQFLADVLACVLRRAASPDAATLEWLLELADSTITYRMRYLSAPQLIPVLDLIVLDPANPHALRFQVHELLAHLRAVDEAFGSSSAEGFAQLEAQLDACDLSAFEPSLFGKSTQIDAAAGFAGMLAGIAARARKTSDSIAFHHFAHVAAASQVTLSA
jgi:uncharacterized circularly permuted ATP-grasp superfamily protein/uncharacterized alpha-E superfamily protein